jgi:predicted RNase H-like HicB family nuclease
VKEVLTERVGLTESEAFALLRKERIKKMRNVNLVYRPEGPGWAASSTDAPNYIAYGESLAEAVKLAHEGIAFHFDLDEAQLKISDFVNTPPGLVLANNGTGVVGIAPRVSGALAVDINIGEFVVPSTAPTSTREAVSVRIETVSAA